MSKKNDEFLKKVKKKNTTETKLPKKARRMRQKKAIEQMDENKMYEIQVNLTNVNHFIYILSENTMKERERQ